MTVELLTNSPVYPVHQQAFEEMKALLVADTLIRYPDHNFPFHIFTDPRRSHVFLDHLRI